MSSIRCVNVRRAAGCGPWITAWFAAVMPLSVAGQQPMDNAAIARLPQPVAANGSAVPATTAPASPTVAGSAVSIPAPTPVAPTVAAPPLPDAQIVETTAADGSVVFGQWLFQGRFAQESFQGFNPDYIIGVGDALDVRLWGAYTFDARLTVDAQGNIFVPSVGPIRVANVRNGDLNKIVAAEIKRVYRENVGIYATLAVAQPVKVFVSGFVKRPGLYGAYASDSLLHFLDRAGGIDPDAGSFLDVRVLRAGVEVARVNLYDFLLAGRMPLIQFRDGDTIFVGPLKSVVTITGLVSVPARYEFDGAMSLRQALAMAGPLPRATHVRLTRNIGDKRSADYLALTADTSDVVLASGDELEVVADRLIGQIVVRVEGEHEGRGQYVLPYDATLGDVLAKIQFSPQSLRSGLQLYRVSIAERQKQMLNEMLDKLEASIFSARSATAQEASLRTQEAALIKQFIERARSVQPKGQLVLSADADPAKIALEDGDVIRIPRASTMVAVHGEVFYPTNFIHTAGLGVKDYIRMSGGLTQAGDADRILILRPNGEIRIAELGLFRNPDVQPGDEILVLPKVQTKSFQFTKDIIEVIYQIAVAAGVVLRL